MDVILGAAKTISKTKPWIIFEMEVPIRPGEGNPMSLLKLEKYIFFDVNKLEKVNFSDLEQNPGVFNVLAVPNNKNFEVQKVNLKTLNLGEPIELVRGDYLFDLTLTGESDCVQGVGVWNLDDSNWEIYYETRIAFLMHSANSCLPIYLESDTRVEIRFGLECNHQHFLEGRLQSLVFQTGVC